MTQDHLIVLLTQQIAEAESTVSVLRREFQFLSLPSSVLDESGTLHVHTSRGYEQYYLRIGKGSAGMKPISGRDTELISGLATKQYYEKMIADAENNVSIYAALLKQARKLIDLQEDSTVFLERFEMVEAQSQISSQGFRDWWLSTHTRCNPYRPEEKVYPTRDGALVRSKSEQSIYNELLSSGIPFRYELELRAGGKTYYPDFTLLDVTNRTEVYFEHFGLMDNESYRIHYYQKREFYWSLGLQEGNDFFCTYEEPGYPFDIRKVTAFLQTRFNEK